MNITEYLKHNKINNEKTKDSLTRIEQITNELIKRYGIESAYNSNGLIHQDRIYAMGLILQLDGVIDRAATPITITKHLAFIEELVHSKR